MKCLKNLLAVEIVQRRQGAGAMNNIVQQFYIVFIKKGKHFRKLSRKQNSEAYGLAMFQIFVISDLFEGMGERVSKIEDLARPRIRPRRLFPFIIRDYRRFERNLSGQNIIKLSQKYVVAEESRKSIWRVPFKQFGRLTEELFPRDRTLLYRFANAGRQFAPWERLQGCCIDKHSGRLMKRADQILAKR